MGDGKWEMGNGKGHIEKCECFHVPYPMSHFPFPISSAHGI
jgi:hypothetical protein